MQNRCSKRSRKIHGKTLMPESLFNKAAGLRPAILSKRHFSTGVFLSILKNFLEHLFYGTPLDNSRHEQQKEPNYLKSEPSSKSSNYLWNACEELSKKYVFWKCS